MAVDTSDPPVSASYQRMVLPLEPSVGVMLPGPQKVVLDAVGAPGTALMVSVTASRADVLSQPVVVL